MSWTTGKHPRRTGFTLVELLVVIAIIGILAAILLPTIGFAIATAKRNRISQELSQLTQAVEQYRNTYGAYPPDFCGLQSSPTQYTPYVTAHFNKAWPRSTTPVSNTNMTLPTGADAVNSSGTRYDVTNLDPSEALPFWLGMVKKDSRQPLNGPGDPVPLFPFDETRLKDIDNDGWLSYVPKVDSDYIAPFVYFNSKTYNYPGPSAGPPECKFVFDTAAGDVVYPYQTLQPNTGPIANYGTGNLQWANHDSFQIISAGLDGEFGSDITGNNPKVYVRESDLSLADDDNMANFSEFKQFKDLRE